VVSWVIKCSFNVLLYLLISFKLREMSLKIFAMRSQILYNDHIIVLHIQNTICMPICVYLYFEHCFIPNHLLRAAG